MTGFLRGVIAMKRRAGRPNFEVTDGQRDRARALLGRTLHRSRVVARLMDEFKVGRPHASAMVDAAVAEFRAELESKGPVDLLVLTTAGLLDVAGGDDSRPRDRVGALAALVRLLGLHKLFAALQSADDVEAFLADVLARRAAREKAPIPTPPAGTAT